MSKKWIEENQGLIVKAGLVAGGGFFLLYLLKQAGIIESKADKEKRLLNEKNATSTKSPFNPNYYKTIPGATLLLKAVAVEYAEQIYDAVGHLYDDETAIYAVFRKLKAKTQVSWLADVFFQEYGEDLYNYLADSLNDDEMDVINRIVNGLAEK